MRIEDKLVRGKSVLAPDGDEGRNQYNVLHILAGTVLVILIPLAVFFASGGNVTMLYVSQYVSVAAVGLSIGYLAGCVPAVTLLVIITATTGKVLYQLLGGKLGSFGSTEFTVRLLAWMAFVAMLFGTAYLGAKIKERGKMARGGE